MSSKGVIKSHNGVVVRHTLMLAALLLCVFTFASPIAAQMKMDDGVELQPLVAQVKRLVEAMDYLGEPFSAVDKATLEKAADENDPARALMMIQNVLDKRSLLQIDINPESRVSVKRGLAEASLVEKGWRCFLIKVTNEAGVTAQLKAASPNALPVYARGQDPKIPGGFSTASRPTQTITSREIGNRWLDISMFDKQPLEPKLSGLRLEYRIIQLYSRDRGRREAQIGFNVGQGTQDIGYRNDISILFNVRPSNAVTLHVLDEDGKPVIASFIIRDGQERIYPAKTKRLAPDFAFQPQIYRADKEQIRLPAGVYSVEFTRGPEYIAQKKTLSVAGGLKAQDWTFQLKRWIDPTKLGWYSGDHHIHAAGCSHYEAPTQGVLPQDIFRHIVGEALSVGDVLTWGPGYYFQKQFFEAKLNKLSTAENLMRYDIEISGFPSSHAGHLTLLDLKEQDYPGTQRIEDWPTWDLPILRWAKAQGAIAGFAHSGWGLEVKSDVLPNYEMPPFDGIGANEYIVDVTHDAVDFISAVDTPPVWELNIWYHTLNSGFRTRLAGETDFPCIYADRVGMGRSYVWLGKQLNYEAWMHGIRDGRAYVSDGKSHLMDFKINDLLVGTRGSELKLDKPQFVHVNAKVAALLNAKVDEAIRERLSNRQPYWDIEKARIENTGEVPLEVIVNGQVVASKRILADGKIQNVTFDIPVEHSSWIALRILPSSHTNPIFVTVGNKPIRASRRSAEWCLKAVDQCWNQKAQKYSAAERPAAAEAYEHARQTYRRIIKESVID